MNLFAIRPKFFDEDAGNHGVILFKALCAGLVLLVATPVSAAESGIRGNVLWGPIKPGPVSPGQTDEEPMSATFNVFAGDRKVAQFKSDAQGKFEVSLASGDYVIVPASGTPLPAPQSQVKPVTVPEEGFAEVTLWFDTGMR